MPILTNAYLVLLYYLVFCIGFQISLRSKRIVSSVERIIGVKNYILIFWTFVPIVLSWGLDSNLSWLYLPELEDLILVPVAFFASSLVFIPEHWYRIKILKDEVFIQHLRRRKITVYTCLSELRDQVYYIGLPEEFISRGFLLTFLIPAADSLIAVLISGISFGVFHLAARNHHDLPKAFTAALSGLILAFSFVYSRSVWIPVAVHILLNLSATLLIKTIFPQTKA